MLIIRNSQSLEYHEGYSQCIQRMIEEKLHLLIFIQLPISLVSVSSVNYLQNDISKHICVACSCGLLMLFVYGKFYSFLIHAVKFIPSQKNIFSNCYTIFIFNSERKYSSYKPLKYSSQIFYGVYFQFHRGSILEYFPLRIQSRGVA